MATVKQKLAFQKVLKGKSVAQAMREVGYAKSTSIVTTKLTKSDGWQELLNKFLPEKKLLKVAEEGLQANKIISANITYGGANEKTNDFIEVPDHPTRHKYLETGLKLHGKLKTDVPEGGNTNNIFIGQLNVEQQRRLAGEIMATPETSAGSPHQLPDSNQS